MLFEKALQLIEASLEAKTGKYLTSLEKEILKAAWNNEPYHTVANSLHLSVGYIKDLAYPLWQQLSDLFGKKVSKNNFRNLITEPSAISTLLSNKIAANEIDQDCNPKGNILIVDDMIKNLRLLTDILQQFSAK